jgi:hypothetical protein
MKKDKKQLAVKIEELPYRAHILDSDSLGKIFGGECADDGTNCANQGKGFCCGGCSYDGICFSPSTLRNIEQYHN